MLEPNSWKPYTPTSLLPWNATRVQHVYQRLAFSATPAEVERALQDGPSATLDRLFAGDGPSTKNEAGADCDPTTRQLIRQAIDRNSIRLLQAAWIRQMWHTSDPLAEQLTLMWHNHFATSFLKVQDCDAMWRQTQTFRRHGQGPFGRLLEAMLRDRALLVWLDAGTNRADQPNENLARELMELFTLGVGHYSEQDVSEAARALTGWKVLDGEVLFEPRDHDAGLKTILGQRMRHDTDSLLQLLIHHKATAGRLAWRLCDHFLGHEVSRTAIQELADHLLTCRLHMQSGLELVARSERFMADAGQRVRSPVAFVVGGLRRQGRHRNGTKNRAASPERAAGWTAVMGQELFCPPGVAGWQGGLVWLSTSSMIRRASFVQAVEEGLLNDSRHREAVRPVLNNGTAFSHLD